MKTTTRETEFLATTNEKAQTRIFDEMDYSEHKKAISVARRMAKAGKPYYWQQDAGTVCRAYVNRNAAFTARSGVYTWLTVADGWTVVEVVDRARLNGNGGCPCIYYGGEVAYNKAIREAMNK